MAQPPHCNDTEAPLSRPRILVATAQFGAARYRRTRDLPAAVAGLLTLPEAEIIPRLRAAEEACESARRARSAAYRSSKHVQILAALLAECADQAKASGSDALRSATKACKASSVPGSISGA